MKKIYLIFTLFLGLAGSAQVRMTGPGTAISSVNSSAFIDASSNSTNNGTTNRGKGLVFPRVNLNTFNFAGTAGIPTNFPTYFDGMIVYNTSTTGVAGAGSTEGTLTEGYWYYYNKTSTITGGTWKKLNINYLGSDSINLNGSIFERAALTGDVTAAANSNSTTISNNSVTSTKIADGTILAADLNQMSATNGQVLKWNGTTWEPAVDNDTTYSGSTSTVLNGTSFERAALTGDVTAAANSNATTIANNAVTSTKILDATIATADVADNAITGVKLEDNIALPGTASMTLPSGTTAQRPATATAGMSRYNTTDSIMEYYNGTAWVRPTPGALYTGSTSTVLNGTSFERAALTGDVTAAANSNTTTIANDAVTSAKILNGTITSADLSATAGITNGQLANNWVAINGATVALGSSTTITASPINTSLASTKMWVGNATHQATAVSMGGDATMSNTGAVTIANNAVTSAKILDATIATADVADNAITGVKLENNIALPGTASMTLPSGTTAQRPATATAGMSRYNTTDSIMEYYNGTAWVRPTPGALYTGSTSTVLNGTSFERAALTGDVTAAANSNVTTIANGVITSAMILDGSISSEDLSASASINNSQLEHNSVTINGTNVALGGSTTITASPTNSTLASTNMWVGNATNQATAVSMGGDATMSNTGAVTIANNAVTSAKILDATIATADVADNAITGVKLENNIALPGTASMTLPSGTTAQRPATASAGMSRYNTTDSIMEYYNGTAWVRPTPGALYTGSTSTVLNGTSFERAALTGDVTAVANSNATTIANNAVTSAKIADGTIAAADLSSMSAVNGQVLTFNGTNWTPAFVNVTSPTTDNYTVLETDCVIHKSILSNATITFPNTLPAGKVFYIVNLSSSYDWQLYPTPLNTSNVYVAAGGSLTVVTLGSGQIIVTSGY